jgi:transposase
MMRPADSLEAVYLCAEPVDFRKGMDGLAALVESALGGDAFGGGLFAFVNRGRNRVKILYWERSGFCLWQKRLEEAHFAWPRHLAKGASIRLTGQQLNWLLDGFDLARWQPHKALKYQSVL